MLYHSFLIKYSEIGTKGKNRYVFEDALVHDIRRKLKRAEGSFRVTRERGRIYVSSKSEDYDPDSLIEALRHVFGIIGICPMVQFENDGNIESLKREVLSYWGELYRGKKKKL